MIYSTSMSEPISSGRRTPTAPDIRRFKIKEDKDMIDREKKAAIMLSMEEAKETQDLRKFR